jgi:hypothetical protein
MLPWQNENAISVAESVAAGWVLFQSSSLQTDAHGRPKGTRSADLLAFMKDHEAWTNTKALGIAAALLLVTGCGGGKGDTPDASADGAAARDGMPPTRDGSSDAELPPPPPDDAGVHGRSSIGWAVDYPADVLTVIGSHTSSFTHVAVLLYDISAYTGGVPSFWNTPGGKDAFQYGLTSADLATKVHSMGLKVLAGVMGGQEFGSNQGLIDLLDDTPPGTQASFVTSMIEEAKTKHYDGYALDLAMGGAPSGLIIDQALYGAKMESFLGAFRRALHDEMLVLTLAFVPNDVEQSCTSYGNGVFDLRQLGRYVDLAMLEAYGTTMGPSSSSSCPASYTDPPGCYAGSIFGPFANEVDLLCSNTAQQAQMTVMMNASPSMTNPFAGNALDLVTNYGIGSVSLFPQINTAGDGGSYVIYDSTNLSPTGSDWFTLLSHFLAAHP